MTFQHLHNPNYKERLKPVNGIIIHSMSEFVEGKFANDFLKEIGLSAHYLIDPEGVIYECVYPTLTAYHAGISEWNGQKNLNSTYIGIEILVRGDNNYSEFLEKITKPDTFLDAQYESCRRLINLLKIQFPKIESDNIVRHSDVSGPNVRPNAPKRDPGTGFNFNYILDTNNQHKPKKNIENAG